MIPFRRHAVLAGVSFLALGAAAPAFAQTAEVDELIVTAQKREQRLLDVGLAVSSLDSETLRTSRVETTSDLTAQVPNVDVKENIPGAQAIVTVRGVGLNDFSSTNNSTVGLYVDEVFLASFAQMDFNFYDLERIEVLKGPQGTLYGRNSTAGAINILTAAPSLKGNSGYLAATAGNYDTVEGEGWANLAVSDTLAVRFSGKIASQNKGFWYSRTLADDLGERDVALARAQLLWQPSEAVKLRLKFETEKDRSELGVGKFFGTIPARAGVTCPDFANPANCVNSHGYTDVSRDKFEGDWGSRSPYRVDQWNGTGRLDVDLGWADLTAVTGYIRFKRGFHIDADAAPTHDAEFDQNDKVKQFSQEVRLAGGSDANVNWIVGAYYSWDRVKTFTPGQLTDIFNTHVLITADQETKSRAVFGQADWRLTDRLRVVTGVRYTDEDRDYVGGTRDLNPFGLSFLCLAVGACMPGPGQTQLSFIDAGISDKNWSWRAGLNFKPTDDSLLYAAVSRGVKSGGFFNGITTTSLALAPYKPEKLTDYEVGYKARLFDRTLTVDASAFWYDYKDLQTQTFTNVGAVSLIKLGNVGEATVKGLDLQATWTPLQGLSLSAAAGLLDTKLGTFQTAGPAGPVTVPKGNKLPNAPDLTLNFQGRYEWAVRDGWTAAVQANAHYSDEVFKEALNRPILSADSYWILDARASLASENGWELAVWVKNLTDEAYVAQATDNGIGMGYRIFNAPRTYGVTLSKRFE
jgi:iron complex outermembrane receptor protein